MEVTRQIVDDQHTLVKYNEILDTEIGKVDSDDITTLIEQMKKAILTACDSCNFTKMTSQNNKTEQTPSWFDKDCSDARFQKNKALRKYRRNSTKISCKKPELQRTSGKEAQGSWQPFSRETVQSQQW